MDIKEKIKNNKTPFIIVISAIVVLLIIVVAMIIIPKENNTEVANTNVMKETTNTTNVNELSNEIENIISNEVVNELINNEEVINETENIENVQVAENNPNETNNVSQQTTKPTSQTTTTQQPTNNNTSKPTTNTNNNTNNNTSQTTTPNTNNNQSQTTTPTQEQPVTPQETPKQEGNPSLANTTFTKYNAERTAYAVNYINNKMKEDVDYERRGGKAVAVTTKPCQDWFSYSGDYRLNGVSGAGRLVKVYVEDVYMYDSKGINTFKYDTRVYAYQTYE